MKKGAGLLAILSILSILPASLIGQDKCYYLTNISNFQPDQLCRPVEVVIWEVSYTDVDPEGETVSIHYDWDDGNTETVPATENPAGTFKASANHIYTTNSDDCLFEAVATMVVGGTMCNTSEVEKTVKVWDVDNKNGARVNASPNTYEVCVGNGATMRFDDNTRYNCVPPQLSEEDGPNDDTRWIQWVYGTNHTDPNFMSSPTPVSVEGYTGPWPYVTDVKELPDGSWGSDERSLRITVADDNLIGEEFEVELRYWNFCNKYTDGKDPVVDFSNILIVGLPDATITPVETLCEFSSSVIMEAADGGGTWSGPGIVNASTGEFSPTAAGPGTHEIKYEVTDGNNCSSEDTVLVVVSDAPDGTITPVDPFCIYGATYDLEASTAGGTWWGNGITDTISGLFDPSDAGPGRHQIAFTTDPDQNGCFGTDTIEVAVMNIPSAEFLTSDSAWCEQENNQTTGEILITGTDSSTFELVIDIQGTRDTLQYDSAGIKEILLDNLSGINKYQLVKIIEHHGNTSCEQQLIDALIMQVNPLPQISVSPNYDDLCSPVEVSFVAEEGYSKYTWDFGDGISTETDNNLATHKYIFNYADHIIGGDTTIIEVKNLFNTNEDTIRFSRHDTVYTFSLSVETINGCADSITGEIPVYPQPKADFFAAPVLLNYPDSVVSLFNLTSVGLWSYRWDLGDSSTSDVKEPVQHEYDTWGFYDITLTSYNDFCRDSISKRVQILPPPPVALFEPDTAGCPPLTVSFTNGSDYADSYFWDFDDGEISREPNPTHVFDKSRNHNVQLSAFGLSGTDTTIKTVFVYDQPEAIFDVYPRESKNLKQNFKFMNNSLKGSYYLWDFGDGTTSPEESPNHIYEDSGTYNITLYVWNEFDCADTLVEKSFIKVMAGEGSLTYPDVFVWNGSGPTGGHWREGEIDNSVFHLHVINSVEFRMEIYTRWGEKIFETNDLYIGWDGYLKSAELATEGVYLWKAWIKYVDGFEEIRAGDITFLH